ERAISSSASSVSYPEFRLASLWGMAQLWTLSTKNLKKENRWTQQGGSSQTNTMVLLKKTTAWLLHSQ
ncbi:hypothetical protein, partial [Vibrio metschnikovii]|uniref:hypothetical protein n=1 Tax=Vibrio metschnikovii TaxID=28172 RepID=UPI002FCA32E8